MDDRQLELYFKHLERDAEFVAESMALSFCEYIWRLMEQQGVLQVDLAQRMGVTRKYVSRLFNASPDLSLHTIAKVCLALHVKPIVTFVELPEGER